MRCMFFYVRAQNADYVNPIHEYTEQCDILTIINDRFPCNCDFTDLFNSGSHCESFK